MACDFVIATQRARWGMPEVDSGITPGWGRQKGDKKGTDLFFSP